MAETLTYDAGTDTVTDASGQNLTPEEQDSLEVGTALVNEQEGLLAGKYENAQQLEKAYVELTKKLGTQGDEDSKTIDETKVPEPDKVSKEEREAKEDTAETSILDTLWDEANSGKGEYSKETLEKLEQMSTSDLANLHLQYRNSQQNSSALTKQDVDQLQGLVGGKENYGNMIKWAQTNLNKQEVDMFDAVMEKGDPLAAFFAVRSLAYRYNDASGYEGELLTGTIPKADTNAFRSQAEVVEAMSNPKYDKDPAYRQEVMEKLERSDVTF